jgi:F-type H+-transporting ATPase subunit b
LLKFDLSILWTFVNIIVLFLFLKKFLFKPVNEIMEKRRNAIQNSLQDAEDRRTEAHQLKSDYEAELKVAGEQATAIVKEAREKAEQEYNKILQEAKQEAGRVMAEADKAIGLEREKAMEKAQAEIAGIAMLAASKLISKNVDNDANKLFLGDFLKEVGAAE